MLKLHVVIDVAISDLGQHAQLTCTKCGLYSNLFLQLVDAVAEVALLAAAACRSEPV